MEEDKKGKEILNGTIGSIPSIWSLRMTPVSGTMMADPKYTFTVVVSEMVSPEASEATICEVPCYILLTLARP